MDTTVVYTPQIHYRHKFHRIDRLGDHHHTISMSELDENDQFEVCWVERNHSGTYFCYAKVSVLRELMCNSLTTSNCSEWHLAQHCLLTNTSSRSLALAITTSGHCATYGHCWHWTQPKPWQSLLSAVDWTAVCGMSQTNINRLQRVQNILAQVVAWAPWTVSSLDIRHDLHWLPVSHRINFKLSLLTWKTLHTARPPYLSELITHYLPPRALTFFQHKFSGQTYRHQ